jgi:hypothetical protein
MGKEFGDNVEGPCRYTLSAIDQQKQWSWQELTPHGTENELNRSVFFPDKIQTDCNCGLADHDCSNVMPNTDWRYLRSVKQFKHVHRNKPVRESANSLGSDVLSCSSRHVEEDPRPTRTLIGRFL